MSLGAWELQAAIYNRLASDTALASLGFAVYDDVPQGSAYPFIIVGEESSTDDGGKDYQALNRSIIVHTFSRYAGSKETKDALAIVYDLLHEQPLTVTDQQVVLLRHDFMGPIQVEGDGLTRHGVMRFRALTVSSSTYQAAVWLTEDSQEWVP